MGVDLMMTWGQMHEGRGRGGTNVQTHFLPPAMMKPFPFWIHVSRFEVTSSPRQITAQTPYWLTSLPLFHGATFSQIKNWNLLQGTSPNTKTIRSRWVEELMWSWKRNVNCHAAHLSKLAANERKRKGTQIRSANEWKNEAKVWFQTSLRNRADSLVTLSRFKCAEGKVIQQSCTQSRSVGHVLQTKQIQQTFSGLSFLSAIC